MAVLKVIEYGDELLRGQTEKITKVSAKIHTLIEDMFDTMYAHNGVGLAAPQVGVMKQLFVLDCSPEDPSLGQMIFINPVIVRKTGACQSFEGCLSFPGVYTDVRRYADITVRFMDIKGKQRQLDVGGGTLLARAIQHELDHLNGVLFVDHVIDRFTAEQQLQENKLPPIDPERLLDEPEIESLLA
ncbi:MAG: peptide deformylase [Candidatus Melainabacteria bacterium]